MPLARPIVIGNWKMNGFRADGEVRVRSLLELQGAGGTAGTLGVCPPATLLAPVASWLGGSAVLLGGQDCASAPKGAHTGDVSAPMLRDVGCGMVIVGHSERRHGHGETDQVVRAKAAAALSEGLLVVLCIGETEAQWVAEQTIEVLDGQLENSLPEGASAATLILAYEPVWAIGTGRTPSTLDIGRTHAHLHARLGELISDGDRVPLLYGGSVKAANAGEIMAIDHVDGVLVGGASLDAQDFWQIFVAGQAADA